MKHLRDKIELAHEILRDMKLGVYDFTNDGVCSNCGGCCSNFLPISDEEVETIRRYIQKHNIEAQKNLAPTAKPVMDFTCPFRNNLTRKCEIYSARPAICRGFKCDKPRKKIAADAKMYRNKLRLVRMREEFFKER